MPSKAIIRTARVYATMHDAEEFGAVHPRSPASSFGAVMGRMRRIRARIAEYHSADRLQPSASIYPSVPRGSPARMRLPSATRALRFRKALVATGARARHCRHSRG